jgi:lysozyme
MKYAKALEIIKQFEGCKLKAYMDSGKPPVATIGYGTTVYPNGLKVKLGDEITREEAESYLLSHCEEMEKHIRETIKFPDLLTDNMMNAICSWTYNIGNSAEAKSTLIKKLNLCSPLTESKADFEAIGDEFLRWNKDNGVEVAGLTNRRKAERELFLA